MADALTKHVDKSDMNKHMAGTRCKIEWGRHELMPEIAQSEVERVGDDSAGSDLGSICFLGAEKRKVGEVYPQEEKKKRESGGSVPT